MRNMKRFFTLTYLLFYCVLLHAQTFKFYYSNFPRFLKEQSNDTLAFPFSGGINTPQVSNIDLNKDGKQDIFIFDRAANKVLTYLYTPTGFTFAPHYEGRFPELRNWALIRDYDGDGKEDLFTEVSQYRSHLKDTVQQVFQNGLRVFRNTSTTQAGLSFRLINNQIMDTGGMWGPPFNLPRAAANVGINNTDIPIIDDMDNDGDLDILSYTGTSFTTTYYDNFTKNKLSIPYPNDTLIYILRDECWGYMQFDVNAQKNKFMLHLGKDQMGSCFFQMYKHGRKHSGTTQLMIDVNGDGIKDVIYGDVGFHNLVALINRRDLNSKGRDSIVSQDTLFPTGTVAADFVLFPAAYYADINGDSKGELLVTTNDPVAAKSKNNVWVYNNTGTHAKPVFNYAGNQFFAFDQSVDLGTRSVPCVVDIDSDGDNDLVVATSGDFSQTQNLNDKLVWYENITSNAYPVYKMKDTNFLQLSKDTPIIQLHPVFADMNADGKPDLIVGNEIGQLLFYQNTSSGSTISFAIQNRKLGDIDVGSHAAPAVYDLNKDNLPDLIIGNKGGIIKYYQNTGTAGVPQFSSTPTIDSLGKILTNETYTDIYGNKIVYSSGYATPALADMDQNGKPELVIGSEQGKIRLYKDIVPTPDSVFVADENIFVDFSNQTTGRSVHFGFRSTPALGLLDGDNKVDIIAGNIRGGLSLYASTNRGGGDTTSVGENGIVKPHFVLYPNPAKNELTISAQNLSDDAVYTIYDMNGRSQLSGTISKYYADIRVNIDALKSGLYFVSIENGEMRATQKLLVVK